MNSILGAKKWVSMNDLHDVLPDTCRWSRLQKYNEKFTLMMDKFHAAASYVKSKVENHPLVQDWSDLFNEILEPCFSKVHQLAFGDFLKAVNSKTMNKVNDQMSEILDVAITLELFIVHVVKDSKRPIVRNRRVMLN